MFLELEKEIECRRGDTGLDNLAGDLIEESLGGERGGVRLGVLLWDAKETLRSILSLETAKENSSKKDQMSNNRYHIYK